MTYETISVAPVTPTIGAEISGVDLSRPLGNQQLRGVSAPLMQARFAFCAAL